MFTAVLGHGIWTAHLGIPVGKPYPHRALSIDVAKEGQSSSAVVCEGHCTLRNCLGQSLVRSTL